MIWGTDISHYQGAINIHRMAAEGFDFCFIKATEGEGWVDTKFQRNLDQARDAGLLVAAYHYQRPDAAWAQVDNIESMVPRDVPVIIDVEHGSGDTWLTEQILTELRRRGFTSPLLYLPPWYWRQIGSPDLNGFPPLWKSRYPDMDGGTVSGIYQRVPDYYWDSYGGNQVAVLQFTSSSTVAGQTPVDGNAYRGTRAELAALLGSGTTYDQEDDMTPEQDAMLRRIEHELLGPRGDEGQISGWGTDIGPRTVVAMLVGLTNGLLAPEPSRVPGAEHIHVPATDAIRDTNGVVYQLPQMIAAAGGADPQAVADALMPALTPVFRQALADVMGQDNQQQATATAEAVVTRVGEILAAMGGKKA